MEAPKEWKGTPEQWNEVIEAFGNLVVAIKEAFKPIVKSFQELYSSLYDVTANPELKRLIKKAKRQQSIRDRRQQSIRTSLITGGAYMGFRHEEKLRNLIKSIDK